MINVVIYKDKSAVIHGFRLEGHAGFSPKGTDVVCAAASVLAINTLNAVTSLTDETIEIESDEKKGVIKCVLPLRRNGIINKDADLLINAMILGFESLEEQYGKYVRIEEAPNND